MHIYYVYIIAVMLLIHFNFFLIFFHTLTARLSLLSCCEKGKMIKIANMFQKQSQRQRQRETGIQNIVRCVYLLTCFTCFTCCRQLYLLLTCFTCC